MDKPVLLSMSHMQAKEAMGLQRAIIAAAHAALPIRPETSAAIANALSRAESEIAGIQPSA